MTAYCLRSPTVVLLLEEKCLPRITLGHYTNTPDTNQVSRQETQEQSPWPLYRLLHQALASSCASNWTWAYDWSFEFSDSNDRIRGAFDGQGSKEATFDGKIIILGTWKSVMNYDHSNIYAAIFQVSAAGTCLGCLLVGLSFLSKVWAFWYRLCHCKEVDPIAILRLNQWYFPSWNRNSTGKGTWTCSLWLGFWYILQPECCSVFSINSREVALSRTFTWSCWSEVFCPLQPGFHWIVFTGHGGDTMGHNVGGTLSSVTWRNMRLLTKTKISKLVDSKECL